MRFFLLAALALAAVPAQAQTRFIDACVASSDADELPFEPAAVCQCTADAVLANGVAAADLDGLIDYVAEDETLDIEAMPEAAKVVASATVESLLGCALAANPDVFSSPDPAAATASPATAGSTLPIAAVPDAAKPTPPPSTSGVRLGGGPAPTRTAQSGPGAAIRILD